MFLCFVRWSIDRLLAAGRILQIKLPLHPVIERANELDFVSALYTVCRSPTAVQFIRVQERFLPKSARLAAVVHVFQQSATLVKRAVGLTGSECGWVLEEPAVLLSKDNARVANHNPLDPIVFFFLAAWGEKRPNSGARERE